MLLPLSKRDQEELDKSIGQIVIQKISGSWKEILESGRFYHQNRGILGIFLYSHCQSLTLALSCIYTEALIFPGGSEVKASASNAGDPGSIPGLGRSPGEGNGTPLQYSCLENPMDGEAW